MVPYQGRGEQDPDSQFVKNIKMMSQRLMDVMIYNFFLIGLNNLTSTSRGTISLSLEKLNL